jgi:23S rRNA (guanosine2251-2'-O)-methyltransferase
MPEFIYGRNPVYECLRAHRRQIHSLWIARGVRERGRLADLLTLAREHGVSVQRVDRHQLDNIDRQINHQGVALQVDGYPYAALNDALNLAERRQEPPWLLILDCLQDPQNLGTLIRTAEAVGVHGIIIPDRRAALVTPAVVNASSGSSEHLYIIQVTNLVRSMKQLKARDVWISGLEGVPEAQVFWQADLQGPLALVVGNEGQGMRRLVQETCDFVVRLPMHGQINSLNAAVAGSIALYEIARQRSDGQ